jgi:hypothetical protein
MLARKESHIARMFESSSSSRFLISRHIKPATAKSAECKIDLHYVSTR